MVRREKGPDLKIRRTQEEEDLVTVWKGNGGGKEEASRTIPQSAAWR